MMIKVGDIVSCTRSYDRYFIVVEVLENGFLITRPEADYQMLSFVHTHEVKATH